MECEQLLRNLFYHVDNRHKQRLGTIPAPTLVIVGEQDVVDFHRIADLLEHGIPGATKVVMPGVGHMANMEDPARFNAMMLGFLADK